MVVNRTMHMDDVLATTVHEGRNSSHILKGTIQRPSTLGSDVAGRMERAFAELRAFYDAGQFALRNNLTQSASFLHGSLRVQNLMFLIAESATYGSKFNLKARTDY